MSFFTDRGMRHRVAIVAVAVAVVSATVVLRADTANCDTVDNTPLHSETASYDSDPDPYRPSVDPSPIQNYTPPIFIQQESSQPERKQFQFSPSVLRAFRYTRTTRDMFAMWAANRKDSMINKLALLPDDQQRRVAYIACYIHKCNRRLSAETVWREACAIYFYGRRYDISPELIMSVAKTESHFNPTSISRHGACGVMQVIHSIHRARLAKRNIAYERAQMFDPERGIHAGVLVLKGYVHATNSVHKGLMRYLGGHSNAYYAKIQNNITDMRRVGETLKL